NAKKGSPLNVTPARVGSQLVPDRTSMSSRASSSSSASDGFDSFDEDEDSEELMLGTPLSQGHGGAAAGGLTRSQSEPSWDDGNSSYQIGDDSASRLIGADEERGGGGVGSVDCWEAVSSWLCCCLKKQDSPKHVFRDELKIHTRRSINFCIAIVFLSNVGFSIIMPSIWYDLLLDSAFYLFLLLLFYFSLLLIFSSFFQGIMFNILIMDLDVILDLPSVLFHLVKHWVLVYYPFGTVFLLLSSSFFFFIFTFSDLFFKGMKNQDIISS
ncbi:MAG: hypothetical protein Q8P67_19325, partial [archaeon]|nr:hypothetical protein [archaeon]